MTRLSAFLTALILLASGAAAAPVDKKQSFLNEKQEIIVLSLERTRSAHFDYQRTLKMGEDRLRKQHEAFKVAGSTPPTALDADVQELRMETQKLRLRRARGRDVVGNPDVEKLIDRYWDDYLVGLEKLQNDVLVHKRVGTPEGQLYWDVMKRYAELRARTEEKLIYNTPPGQSSLDEILVKNEWKLLKNVERGGVKTRNPVKCVVAPDEHPRQINVDAAPFFHSQGMLPTASPLGTGAFFIPAGCRTVTKRESGVKLVLRVSKGKGVVYVGSSEKELSYGYFPIPPDSGYYIENVAAEPLDIEYVVLNAN